MKRPWAWTVCGLAAAGAYIVFAATYVMFGDTPGGLACGVAALACTTIPALARAGRLRDRVRQARRAWRARRGWTEDDEAVLRGDRSLL
jgi:hypothetical protein